MADLMASGTNPGATYTISPSTDPGVYHEDRVVVTEVAPSTYVTQMFRVYGATLGSSGWTYVGASTAYATVQNPDGSIHYFSFSGTAPWSTQDWVGSSNNTLYNPVDFALNLGANPADLTNALTSTFAAIFNATPVGGGVWVPESGYQVDSSPSGIQVPYNTILQGLGTSGVNQSGALGEFHFSITGTGSGPNGNILFNFPAGAAHSSGGTLFQNLGFSWLDSTCANDACINAITGWNTRLANCFFLNCPIVLNCSALASGVDGSSIKYEAGSPNNAVAVILQSPQCFAAGPGEYAQDAVNPSTGGGAAGPTNCVAVMICGGPSNGEHCWVRDVHLSEFSYGVCFNTQNAWGGTYFCTATMNSGNPLNSGSQEAVVTNVHCQAYVTAVYIQPAGDTGQIFDVKVSDSFLIKSQNSLDGHAIAYVDTNLGANADVSGVEFVNCTIYSNVTTSSPHTGDPKNGQYGLQLNAGDKVRVIGGSISNMGTRGTPQTDGTANIAITGAVGEVIINGVDLSPQAAIAAQQRPSQWGLLVTGDIAGPITVSNCTFGTSNWGAGGPVSVTGTVSASSPLYITNCPGYNDQNTSIASGTGSTDFPTSTTGNTAATAGALTGGINYYGPTLMLISVGSGGSQTLHINGISNTLPASSFSAISIASPYDVVYFSGTNHLSAFHWIGK